MSPALHAGGKGEHPVLDLIADLDLEYFLLLSSWGWTMHGSARIATNVNRAPSKLSASGRCLKSWSFISNALSRLAAYSLYALFVVFPFAGAHLSLVLSLLGQCEADKAEHTDHFSSNELRHVTPHLPPTEQQGYWPNMVAMAISEEDWWSGGLFLL